MCLLEPHVAVAHVTRNSKVSAKVPKVVKAKATRPKSKESGQANLQRNRNKSNLEEESPEIILENNSSGSLSLECMLSHRVSNSLPKISDLVSLAHSPRCTICNT